jgi:putative PIN family toxin of toxin-antitoxin system
MIVVLDCNIWISLTINSQIDFIAELSDNRNLIAIYPELRHEIETVLKHSKLAKFITPETK